MSLISSTGKYAFSLLSVFSFTVAKGISTETLTENYTLELLSLKSRLLQITFMNMFGAIKKQLEVLFLHNISVHI